MKKLLILSTCAALATPMLPASLAVTTSNWTHTSETDFKSGTFDNVVATNLGDLKLSRAVRTLMQQNPKVSSVNALVQAPDGTIYAGTGPHGLLLKIAGEQVSEVTTIEGATHLFCLAIDKDGGLLIGTGGESGRVLRIAKPGEKPVELFKADGVQYVWSMVQTADDGKIYAATGPNGQLFEISAAGPNRVVLDVDENNLLSLTSDGKDLLYTGTDPNGLVYRINRKTNESFIVYDAPEAEVSALVIDKAGNVYAGTAEARDEPQPPKPSVAPTAGRPESQPAGVPIPSEPPTDPEPPKVPDPNPGQPAPIPKAAPMSEPAKPQAPTEAATPSPAIPGEGRGEGSPSKPNAQNEPTAPPDANPPAQNEPKPAPSETEPKPSPAKDKAAETPSKDVGRGKQRPTAPGPSPVPPPGAPRPPGSAVNPDRMIPGRPPVDTTGTGQPRPDGNGIYRIDADGFVTEVFRQRALVLSMAEKDGILFVATGSEGLVYQVNPTAEETIVLAKVDPKQVTCLLPASDGRLYMGMANVGGIASIGSGFAASGSYTSPVLDATQISRFGKMQLHGSLPVGTTLTVSTRSGNVKDATQTSWSKWTEPVNAAEFVQVASPTARFLQYKLAFTSGAEGKATPVVEDVGVAYQVPNLPPQVKSVRITPQAEAQAPARDADAEPARVARAPRQQIAWEASDPNGDSMRYALHFRRGAGGPWILLRENIAETQLDWDTRSVADGRYEIRVTANDSRANPPGKGRSDARVSDPVLVDNTAPIIGSVKWQQKGPEVEVALKVIDRSSIVTSLDYSVNAAKGWQAVLPSDSIFDSPEETVSLSVPGLAAGSHQVTVRATDARGNQSFESVLVNVDGGAAEAK